MPPYITIETYIPCPKGTANAHFGRFLSALRELGHSSGHPKAWEGEINLAAAEAWADDNDETVLGCTTPAFPLPVITFTGKPLIARAAVNYWSPLLTKGLTEAWLECSLHFPTSTDEQNLTDEWALDPGSYLPGAGHALWQVMTVFAAYFPESPIYCADELGEGEAWDALETAHGKLWLFDMAIVPDAQIEQFATMPDEYTSEAFPTFTAFASRWWTVTPWDE